MFETYGTFPSVIPERTGISIDYGTFMGHMGHEFSGYKKPPRTGTE